MKAQTLDIAQMKKIAGGSVTEVKTIEFGGWKLVQTTFYPIPMAGAQNKPVVTYEIITPWSN